MVVVECTPLFKRIREAELFDNAHIVCTVNSFTSKELDSFNDAHGDDYRSAERYSVVINGFRDYIDGDVIENTKRLLRGDYGFMCQYDNEPDFETVWSSVFDLESLQIYRAEDDPRKKKFITDNRLHDLIGRKNDTAKIPLQLPNMSLQNRHTKTKL